MDEFMSAPLAELFIPIRPLTANWSEASGKRGKKARTSKARGEYKIRVKEYAAKHTPIPFPLVERLEVEYTIYVTGNKQGEVGDFDNYCKPLGNALEGVLWMNDNQIGRGTGEVIKVFCREDQGIGVKVWRYQEGGRLNGVLSHLRLISSSMAQVGKTAKGRETA